jgi:hypothetical protein
MFLQASTPGVSRSHMMVKVVSESSRILLLELFPLLFLKFILPSGGLKPEILPPLACEKKVALKLSQVLVITLNGAPEEDQKSIIMKVILVFRPRLV